MNRTHIIFAVIIIFSVRSVMAQTVACTQVINDGKALFDLKKYTEAKMKFEAAKRINCDNAQYWINECNKKIKELSNVERKPTPPPSQKPLAECNLFLRRGIERYNEGNFEEAKTFFTTAKDLGCDEANGWIDQVDKQVKEMICKSEMDNGTFYYNKGEYAMALVYFENAASNGCFGADVGIQRCKTHIAAAPTPLDLTDVRRMINLIVGSHPTQSFDNGEYKGETLNLQRHGIGIYTWANGTIYIGEFQNELQSRTGIYMVQDGGYSIPNCPDCSFYVGGWENGKKKGIGYCYDEAGKLIYSGNFINDMPTDNYPSSGNYSSLKFEVIKYTDDRYLGETKGGKPNGKGIYLWKNGKMWYGEWENGAKAGYGIEIKLDGNIMTGYWTGDSYSSTK